MKLPAPAIIDAIGVAASLAGGVSANFGTMTKPLHSGAAARNGIMAAVLAARGFTASKTALEGKSGYFDTFNRALPQVDGAFGDLGTRYDLLTRGYKLKRYPCGGLGHTAIDATLLLREQLNDRVGEIERIEAGITKNAAQRIKDAYPDTIESAKFSMPYIAAWTILNGPPSLRTFTMDAIADARVKALSTKISHHVDAEFADEVEEAPGRVRVTLASGQVFEQKVWYASGSPENPMTPAQIEAKFMDCALLTKTEAQARRVFAFVRDLPNKSSFDGFWPLLGAG
jgi:2-methylcitrate dehydratase PrpD